MTDALDTERLTAEFVSRLSPFARNHFQPGQVITVHLSRAFTLGWTPAELAKHCSRDLPGRAAWAAIQSRVENCANTPPPNTRPAAAPPVKWCGNCDDPNSRWMVDPTTGALLRVCPDCSPQREVAT